MFTCFAFIYIAEHVFFFNRASTQKIQARNLSSKQTQKNSPQVLVAKTKVIMATPTVVVKAAQTLVRMRAMTVSFFHSSFCFILLFISFSLTR